MMVDQEGRKTILVVDDDRDMVETLCDILELRGWRTLRGYDGDDAVALGTKDEVDWVLMDVRMPRRSGIDAAEAILRVRPNAQAILMTAFASRELESRAKRLAGIQVLRKPFDLSTLFSMID
jgi:DNA-binding NtrC family response regulator